MTVSRNKGTLHRRTPNTIDAPGNAHLPLNDRNRQGLDPSIEPKQAIYWCPACRTPITQLEPGFCPSCNSETRYLTTDVRPVFSRERRILQFYGYGPLVDIPVWRASKARTYYIDGASVTLPESEQLKRDLPAISEFILASDHYDAIDKQIIAAYQQSLEVNRTHLNDLEDQAFTFIQQVARRYSRRLQMVSFSGGKDSTVVSHLVRRALGRADVLHVFGDTTLEDPNTYAYVQAFQQENPLVPFLEAKAEHDFHQLVEQMGPPSRQIRWCCTIFKAGPINNLLQTLGDNTRVLTFYGIRHAESKQRSDYNAVTVGAKIGTQITASPIIEWSEFDIWLYILLNEVHFNDSYRLGYTRVGCWLCPLNSEWSDMLAALFFPEDSVRWRGQLVSFARKIGKPDPEEYVDNKGWKKRTGGAGLDRAFTGLEAKPCGDSENAIQYTLERPVNEELAEFLKPLGRMAREKGRPALGESLIEAKDETGKKTKTAAEANPLNLLVQAIPGTSSVRVTALDPVSRQEYNLTQSYVRRQLIKFQTCIQCTACSAVCPHGAIVVRPEQRVYKIDEDKCTGCLECVTHFGSRGCLVADSLHSYEDK